MPHDRDRPLRVGLNLVWMTEHAGGAGRYARELIPALLTAAPGIEITVFVGRDAPAGVRAEPWAQEVRFVELPVRTTNALHLVGQFGGLPVLARRRRLDLVHGLANVVPVRMPGVRSVVTVLDLIWLHLPTMVAMTARDRRSWRWLTRLCATQADRVIAISRSGAEDVASTYALDRSRVDAIPLGARIEPEAATPEAELRRRIDLGAGPVMLCVAQKQPYKQQSRLIQALADLGRPEVRLVLPGAAAGTYEDDLRAQAARLGVAAQVRLVGWVDEADLEGLYALATGVVLPSLMEGFGLPVLEAMGRGVPVACSDRSALAEVGADAALQFDPTDQAAVTAAVARLLDDADLRADLAAKGLARSAQFTWQRTAELTLASYDATLART